MILPLKAERPIERPTLVTYVLIALNMAIFFLWMVTARIDQALGMRLVDLTHVGGGDLEPWRFVTSMFMHGSVLHLLGNMLFLWVFGPCVEDRLGRWWFGAFYFAAGICAGLTHVFFDTAPAIGASGAISGVTGAFLVLFPRVQIRTLLFFFLIGVFPIPAWMYLAFALAKDLVFVDWVDDGVARAAHLGGWFFGAIVSIILLRLHLIRREPWDLFMIGRQAARRRELREASRQQSKRVEKAMSRTNDAVQRFRTSIATSVSAGDIDGAASTWLELARAHGRDHALVSRDQQYLIARHLVERGDHQHAALAIERFVEAHPRDPETPSMRLLLGLVCLRYLNDPVRAKAVLAEARDTVRDPDEREFATQLLEEAG